MTYLGVSYLTAVIECVRGFGLWGPCVSSYTHVCLKLKYQSLDTYGSL